MSLASKLAFVGIVFAIMAAVTFGTPAKTASADGPCIGPYNYNMVFGQPYRPPCFNPGFQFAPGNCGLPYRPPCYNVPPVPIYQTPIYTAPLNCGVALNVYGQPMAQPCLNNGYLNNGYLGYTNCGGYALACNGAYAGVPAKMNLAVSPPIVTCGNAVVTVSANVTDIVGVPVANGTAVSFSSTIGTISSASTIGGNATTTLLVPGNSPAGVAVIRVSAGAAASSTTVQVNCAPAVQQVIVVAQQPAQPSQATVIYRPAPGQYQQPPVIIQRPRQQQPVPYAPPFAPPRTGEVGLADPANLVLGDDSAADQALVNAWSESQYGVLDASQYDSVVTPDDSTASSQLAQDLLDSAYGVIDASQVDMVIVGDDSAATTTLVIDVVNNPSDYGNA